MKIAIISDIHANLIALEEILISIDNKGVDRIVCLGDMVGYGARPNECIRALITRKIPCIMGNHDEAAVGRAGLDFFNQWARDALIWTAGKLSKKSREFLNELPYTIEFEHIYFVHASPFKPAEWHYLFSEYDARIAFDHFSQRVCFVGHSHIPVKFTENGNEKMVINVGSVGQPRDRDPRACWGLYDTETAEFKWLRVDYKIEETADQILSAGLPAFLADRLFSGI